MFKHIFINRLKVLLREKELIFWTLLFPIVLATFFQLALSNITSGENFEPIPVAVISNEKYNGNEGFKIALEEASKGEDSLFQLAVTTEETAAQLLENSEIDGYILVGFFIELVVRESGLNQNIIKRFLDSYMQIASSASYILSEYPADAQAFLASLGDRQSYIEQAPLSSSDPDPILNYFYSLIAMACFYGGVFGNIEITNIQANLSTLAARINVAPVHKFKAFLASLSACAAVHFAELLVLLGFTILVLKIDFGTRTGLVLLTTFIGSVLGISFGAFISALIKKSENLKTGILIAVTMFCSFLAGMMYQDMKYIIAENAPILSYLNPVNLLTDAFYSLYYFDTLTRFALNMGILGLFIAVFWIITYMLIRRRKYASI